MFPKYKNSDSFKKSKIPISFEIRDSNIFRKAEIQILPEYQQIRDFNIFRFLDPNRFYKSRSTCFCFETWDSNTFRKSGIDFSGKLKFSYFQNIWGSKTSRKTISNPTCATSPLPLLLLSVQFSQTASHRNFCITHSYIT